MAKENNDEENISRSKNSPGIGGITDAVLLAIASGLSYYCAYKYETGYLGHFGLPEYLAVVSLEQVSAAFSAFVALFVVIIITIDFVIFVMRAGFAQRYPRQTILILIYVLWFILMIVIIPSGPVLWFSLLFFALFLLTRFIPPLFNRDQKPYLERFEDHITGDRHTDSFDLLDRLGKFIGVEAITFVAIAVLILPFVAELLGTRAAIYEAKFLVADRVGPWALIRSYGNYGILARFDASAKTTSGLFEIVHLGGSGELQFVLWDVGPLKSPP